MERPSFLRRGVIGMVHLEGLPGTPKFRRPLSEVISKAVSEAVLYKEAKVDAVMLENMHDVPYCRTVGPEIVASMTVASSEVRRALGAQFPIGIQVLAANNKEAIAIAQSASLQFVRVEGFVFGHVADEGYIDGCAGPLLRYRKSIGAENVLVFSDIKKKHSSHSITADVTIEETAKAAEYFLADGVIVTGAATGCEADEDAVKHVHEKVKIPTLVGSGCTVENVQRYLAIADALIVGSHFKEGGNWENPVSKSRVQAFMDKVLSLRH